MRKENTATLSTYINVRLLTASKRRPFLKSWMLALQLFKKYKLGQESAKSFRQRKLDVIWLQLSTYRLLFFSACLICVRVWCARICKCTPCMQLRWEIVSILMRTTLCHMEVLSETRTDTHACLPIEVSRFWKHSSQRYVILWR